MCNACQLSHTYGLASSAFARHYLRNHGCFLFLWVLRCFTSPRSLQLPYIFRQRLPDMTPVFQGFPIRKSTDQSLFTNSPWLIAGYNVLHRLLMPRHPPIALSSLSPNQNDQQQKIYLKMLASTIQFSNNNPNQTKHPHKHGHPARPRQQRNPQPHSTHQKQHAKNSRKFQNPTTCTPNTTPTTTNVPHPPK